MRPALSKQRRPLTTDLCRICIEPPVCIVARSWPRARRFQAAAVSSFEPRRRHGEVYNAFFIYAAQAAMAMFVDTFKDFPAVQRPNTFTVDDALRKMTGATQSCSRRGSHTSGTGRGETRASADEHTTRIYGRS